MVKGTEQIEVERHRFEGLVIYEVTADEITQLKTETQNIGEDFNFAVVGFSVGTSFLTTLLTVDIQSDRTFLIFLALCALGFVVAVYCGIKWLRGRNKLGTTIKRIERRIGPFGQEGKEISPTDPTGIPQEPKPEGGR